MVPTRTRWTTSATARFTFWPCYKIKGWILLDASYAMLELTKTESTGMNRQSPNYGSSQETRKKDRRITNGMREGNGEIRTRIRNAVSPGNWALMGPGNGVIFPTGAERTTSWICPVCAPTLFNATESLININYRPPSPPSLKFMVPKWAFLSEKIVIPVSVLSCFVLSWFFFLTQYKNSVMEFEQMIS